MHLVFVHGIRQEGKDPKALQDEWEKALTSAWSAAGLARREYTLEMPFYGDILNNLTEEVRGKSKNVVARGEGGPGTFTPLAEAIIREMGAKGKTARHGRGRGGGGGG